MEVRADASARPAWSHGRAVAVMVAVTLMWSIAGVVTRHLESAARFEVTFWRSAFTALALLVLLPAVQGRGTFARMRSAGPALWLSGVCWSVMFTAFMVALTMTSTASVLITMSVGPLLTALFAWALAGHRIAARTWAAIAVAGVGIAWMFGSQLGEGPGSAMAGTLIALLVPLAASANWTIVQRSHAQGHDVDLVPAVLVGALLSAAATLPLAFPFAATPHDLALLALLGVVQLAIPCALAVRVARVLPAPEVALLALLEVLFGIALAWAGAGERPGPTVLAGGALVVGALVANEMLGWRRKP